MLAAVKKGNAQKVAELMRQDPDFNVNKDQDGFGRRLLHFACDGSRSSPVIPLLLAHPDIDVNAKDKSSFTPFIWACNGHASCVREMLKDSRVQVKESDSGGSTPFRWAATYGHLNVIKWWIASGREMDVGKPGDWRTDAIGEAKKNGNVEVVTLLERFKKDAAKTRHAIRIELGLLDELAAEMFALVVFISDGLLQVNETTTTTTPAARFFSIVRGLPFLKSNPKPHDVVGTQRFFRIAAQLPLELQMILCYRVVGLNREIISGQDSEVAFKDLAKRI